MVALATQRTSLLETTVDAEMRLASTRRRLETNMTHIWPHVGLQGVRILGAGGGVKDGIFDNPNDFAAKVAPYDGAAESIYCFVNPISPEVVRAKGYKLNQIRGFVPRGGAITDEDVLCRTRLFVDIDPAYNNDGSGGPATHWEHCEALALQGRIVLSGFMSKLGFAPPIEIDSGNGAYLLYPIDKPNTPESRQLIKGCLEALASRFDCEGAKVDVSTHNASRLMRVPGTLNRKWAATSDRPYRRSCLVLPGVKL